MGTMTRREAVAFIKSWAWGTLIGVEGNKPYAVEVSYGTDGNYIYCGSKPGGRMAKCISNNKNVVFKICKSDHKAEKFKAVIIEGEAERLTSYEAVLHCLRSVAKQSGLKEGLLDPIAKRHYENPALDQTSIFARRRL